MKEISYIPTDAYAAGEMKHGPIALLDESTPVVCVATNSPILDKVLSNIAEVRARGADELSARELRAGARRMYRTVRRFRPVVVAFLGIGAFRIAFDRPRATIGPQPENIEGAQVWVLPNPSGLNAHYQLAALSAEFGRLKAAVSAARRRHVRRPGTDPRACGAAAAAPAGSRSPR